MANANSNDKNRVVLTAGVTVTEQTDNPISLGDVGFYYDGTDVLIVDEAGSTSALGDAVVYGVAGEMVDVDLATETAGTTAKTARIDHKHQLSQSIAPTWSGAHVFSSKLGFGTAQALSGPGAVNITAIVTKFTSTGTGDALTLANGTIAGQIKIVHHTVDGGSGVLTPATAGNFATFTFTTVHDACLLMWNGSAWDILLNVGGTVG